jgi:hypothetical protein
MNQKLEVSLENFAVFGKDLILLNVSMDSKQNILKNSLWKLQKSDLLKKQNEIYNYFQ